MDIKKITDYSNQMPAQVQEPEFRAAEQTKTPSAKLGAAGEASDRVQLSQGYQQIDKIKNMLRDMADIRTERIEQIGKMVQSGTYEVRPDLVAARMLDDQV